MFAWWTETRFQQMSSFELSAIMSMKWPVSNYQIVLCGAKRYIVISISLLCLMLSLLVDWQSLPATTARINNHHHPTRSALLNWCHTMDHVLQLTCFGIKTVTINSSERHSFCSLEYTPDFNEMRCRWLQHVKLHRKGGLVFFCSEILCHIVFLYRFSEFFVVSWHIQQTIDWACRRWVFIIKHSQYSSECLEEMKKIKAFIKIIYTESEEKTHYFGGDLSDFIQWITIDKLLTLMKYQ